MITATTVGKYIPAIKVDDKTYYLKGGIPFANEADALDFAGRTVEVLNNSLSIAIRKSHYVKWG